MVSSSRRSGDAGPILSSGSPKPAHAIGHDRDYALIADVVYPHPGFEREANGHVATDAGRNGQRGVGQRGQRVLGGQHLERLRVQHGCAESGGERRGRAARLPFLHADKRCSLCGTEPDERARTGEEDPRLGAEQLFVQQPEWRWACRLHPDLHHPFGQPLRPLASAAARSASPRRPRWPAASLRPCSWAWVPGLCRSPTPSSAPARPVRSSSVPPKGRSLQMTVTRPSDKPGDERSRASGQRLTSSALRRQRTLRGIVRWRWWRALCRSGRHGGSMYGANVEIGSLSGRHDRHH